LSDSPPVEDFEDLYETAPCGYVSISPDGRIVKANRTVAEWLGLEPAQLVGTPLHDIFSFGARIAFETHLAPLLRMQGHVHEIALDLVTSGGEKVPTIGNAAEKRDSEGRHLFTRLTLFKAVDRRTYERSLVEARARAEAESEAQRDAIALRDQFAAVLGHDLRNPLAATSAGIHLLDRTEQLSERGRAILDEMKGCIGRASTLVDDLLDLARGSFGGGFLVERNADAPLAPVLEQVVSEARSVSLGNAIDLRIDIEEPVYCDRGRIAQLAANLLANAVTHGNAEQPILLDARTDSDSFMLSVVNGGEPIPEEILGQLFQPFFRGAARPSRNGLGLGLFIASEIAKAHGGRLEVASSAEATRFTLTMPARKPSA
jgi:sigma-B regulation protein RsbU (phosphoserine phosphatase)